VRERRRIVVDAIKGSKADVGLHAGGPGPRTRDHTYVGVVPI
jgi:molybdopterin biosynthesis enzyme MoaB